MAIKDDSKEVVSSTPILPERIHIKQFLVSHPEMDVMQQAGFKALCGKEWMRPSEWEEQLIRYFPKENKEKKKDK